VGYYAVHVCVSGRQMSDCGTNVKMIVISFSLLVYLHYTLHPQVKVLMYTKITASKYLAFYTVHTKHRPVK
jgi:hypothetical protein